MRPAGGFGGFFIIDIFDPTLTVGSKILKIFIVRGWVNTFLQYEPPNPNPKP
jgi:hypothetical protein